MKQMFLAIAASLIGAGEGLSAFANGAPEDAADTAAATTTTRGRGRPPKATGAADTGAAAGATGPTDEERLKANQLLIEPLVKNSQGDDVKKVIAKYSQTGLKGIPAESQAAFAKDIEALTY